MARNTMTCPTHFVVENANSVYAFDVDTCDECGCECEAANGITIRTTARNMRMLGSKEMTERLPELGACEALGGITVCPSCFINEA